MNPTVVQSVLGGVILAALVWIGRSLIRYGETLAVMRAVLVGENGDNGIKSEVDRLRDRSHEHTNQIHTLKGNHALLKQRVDTLEAQS